MAQRLLAPPPPSPSPLRVCEVSSSPFPLLLSRLRFPLSLLFPLPSLSPLSLPFLLSLSLRLSPSYPFQFRSDMLIHIYIHIRSSWLRPVPLARVPTSTPSAHV